MTDFLTDDVSSLVVIEKFSQRNLNNSFLVDEKYAEYRNFLYSDALNYQSLYISQTYLLIEKETRDIAVYIFLASDTVALNPRKKEKGGAEEDSVFVSSRTEDYKACGTQRCLQKVQAYRFFFDTVCVRRHSR